MTKKYFSSKKAIAVERLSQGYKGILPYCVIKLFVKYNCLTKKFSYNKRHSLSIDAPKGIKRKKFLEAHVNKGYYILAGTEIRNNKIIEHYELTEDGEDLFTILEL